MDERTIEQRLDAIETILRLNHTEIMTEAQAAEYLQVTVKTLQVARSEARIDFIALGGGDVRAGSIRYTKQDLDNYLRRHKHRARQGRE